MPEFYIEKETKPIITKKCAICEGSIRLESPEIICPHCKQVISWLKDNQYELAHIIAQERGRKL